MFAFVEPAPALRRHLRGADATCTTSVIWCPLCDFNVQTFMVGAIAQSLQDYHETVCINTTPQIREAAFNRMFPR